MGQSINDGSADRASEGAHSSPDTTASSLFPCQLPDFTCPHSTRVAVVDDDASVRDIFHSILSLARGVRCVGLFSSGTEAIAKIPAVKAEVVLMDIRMPGMDGFECTKRLLEVEPSLSVIIVTGLQESAVMQQGVYAGASHCLVKPVTPSQFRASVVQLVNRCPGKCPMQSSAPEGTQVRCYCGFRKQGLTDEEMAVLECLAHGLTYRKTEKALNLTKDRVKKVQHRVFVKLGISNRYQTPQVWEARFDEVYAGFEGGAGI